MKGWTVLCLMAAMTWAVAAAPSPGNRILNDLQRFRQMGTVLYVAAHPDDENTQLIAWFARGRHYRTGYLSLTRGDGGQNLLGPEFGSTLGVIRTEELLAARSLDGGVQFFTRARDFGFSKDYKQTLTRWNRAQVVDDIVRVMREFRPDVVITRFPPEPSHTHGHHTASAVLAKEAFQRVGDATYQDGLPPWQPRRLLVNQRGAALQMAIDGTDALTGESFGELAAQSRAMHKTQGFGNFTNHGGPHVEDFRLLAGEPATHDVFDGIDTTWNRVPGGAPIQTMIDSVITSFKVDNPAESVPALLKLHEQLGTLPSDPLIAEKRRLLDHVILQCLGFNATCVTSKKQYVPGEKIALRQEVVVRAAMPVRWVNAGVELKPGQVAQHERTIALPANAPLSQPYWLREDGTPGMFRVDDKRLIGRPLNPPVIAFDDVFEVGGQKLTFPVDVDVDVVAPASLSFASDVQLFRPSTTRQIAVAVTSTTPGTLRLEAPAGWKVAPLTARFSGSTNITFTVTAPAHPQTVNLVAHARVGGREYSAEHVAIHYAHVPPILLQPPARLKAVCLDLKIAGHRVGYLPGAGDSIPACLQQMGYEVQALSGTDLTPEKLRTLDAVVVGVRAFNVRTDLAANLPALFDWVHSGGTVVVQYNTPKGLQTPTLAPYDLKLSDDLPKWRVTDENSPVTWLVPDHPVFTIPNRLDASDFAGWVQERGLDFPAEWDTAHFTALIACSDVGEPPLQSGLLVAHYGQGYYVYTGLSFFRQLPAGVAGAYRLFANLVSLGK